VLLRLRLNGRDGRGTLLAPVEGRRYAVLTTLLDRGVALVLRCLRLERVVTLGCLRGELLADRRCGHGGLRVRHDPVECVHGRLVQVREYLEHLDETGPALGTDQLRQELVVLLEEVGGVVVLVEGRSSGQDLLADERRNADGQHQWSGTGQDQLEDVTGEAGEGRPDDAHQRVHADDPAEEDQSVGNEPRAVELLGACLGTVLDPLGTRRASGLFGLDGHVAERAVAVEVALETVLDGRKVRQIRCAHGLLLGLTGTGRFGRTAAAGRGLTLTDGRTGTTGCFVFPVGSGHSELQVRGVASGLEKGELYAVVLVARECTSQ